MDTGQIEAIVVGAQRAGMLTHVDRVRVHPGQGVEGDRHFRHDPSPDEESGRDLTLIEAEALEALEREQGIPLQAHEARRNVVTRGISLNHLVGRRFRVGELEYIGVELCEPCRHLASLTYPGVLRGLVHRGGLRADVARGGSIAVGDEVAPL
jgi:MOSC domain-containing protein YiiM